MAAYPSRRCMVRLRVIVNLRQPILAPVPLIRMSAGAYAGSSGEPRRRYDSGSMSPPEFDLPTLVARLAEGHGTGITVLTPNLRLARALEAEVDRVHLEAGHASWEAPDILPFSTFVERCHDEALHTEAGAGLPLLLSDAASRLLWEEAIRAGERAKDLVSIPSTATLASEAWALAHAWRID